ncbi:MAG: glycosyltransferase [Verrucomicrobiota bacterium]|nr:glycosyltransferase [Verrucomicrobiota bacterium]
MSAAPLLSICIPTWNRANYLRGTLGTLLESMRELEASIELIISDNASDDETPRVIAEFAAKIPVLRAYRNPENIGELNYYAVSQRATGEFLWLLGDDDQMSTNLLPTIIGRLKTAPDLVVCNHSIHSLDFSVILKPLFYRGRKRSYRTRDEVLSCFGVGLGFISAVVMRRENFAAISKSEHKEFAPYGLSFFYALCASLPIKCRTEFIAEPLLHNRAGNSNTPDWNRIFITGVGAVLTALNRIGYSLPAIRKAKDRAIRDYILPRLALLKRNGEPAGPLLGAAYSVYCDCMMYWCVALPLLIVPQPLIAFAKRTLRR